MEIKLLKDMEFNKYAGDIWNMLVESDGEFVPPLSSRVSTTQTDFSFNQKVGDGIGSYFEELKKQRLLIAVENGELVAFVSFRENYENDRITAEEFPNIYISTVLVSANGRGKGLTQKMYEALFKKYEGSNIFTRTWSTNMAHIKILSKFEFETFCVLKDDRGRGIDTVYFKKSIT